MIRLDHADCREWLPTLADGSVDVVITDPPYDEHTHAHARSLKGGGSDIVMGFEPLTADLSSFLPHLLRVSRRWVVAFCALEQLGHYRDAAGDAWVRAAVWHRTDGTPQISGDRPAQGAEGIAVMHRARPMRWNGHGERGCWTYARERKAVHPTQKPLDLMERLVSLFSDPDETILDPFAGSGTTLLAARRLGRNAIGCERDRNNYEVAHARLFGSTADQSIAGKSLPLFAGRVP